ncbi:MAG: AAA family ATPase, partial [Thermoanaerobaculia bacterium]
GVTVVVGPNGTGKSNIVDAVAWVMGTQATSALRTQRMEDVIFAGTAVRPALGRAEVALTLDNSTGGLALDLAEVTITRRLYRDGTSEYEINGTPCRLLDIQELLADSGVGRHQHVLVGQGRVDSVLNASPEEHRAIIEEAAGVIKHRQRRDRSIRRLEATDDDLVRLQDLLAEQHRLMRPLKRQARAAERHEEARAEWRALRLWLGGERLRAVRHRLEAIEGEGAETAQRLDAAETERAELSQALGGLQAAAGETGAALDRDTAAAARLETTAERMQKIALVARERRLGMERRLVGASERRRDLEAEREHLISSIADARAEESTATEAAERLAQRIRELEDEERSLAAADRLPADGVAASLRGDLAALEAAAVRDHRELSDLARRRGAVAAVIEEELAETQRLGEERTATVRSREEEQKSAAAAADRASVDAEAARLAEEARHEAQSEATAARARAEALEEARRGLTDPETVEFARRIESIVGPIAARLDVPPQLAEAVGAALGPWAEAQVAQSPEGALAAALTVKDAGRGGVAFVAALPDSEVLARGLDGGRGALVDALGSDADADLAATLLGDVVVVPSLAEAAEVVASRPDL